MFTLAADGPVLAGAVIGGGGDGVGGGGGELVEPDEPLLPPQLPDAPGEPAGQSFQIQQSQSLQYPE